MKEVLLRSQIRTRIVQEEAHRDGLRIYIMREFPLRMQGDKYMVGAYTILFRDLRSSQEDGAEMRRSLFVGQSLR